MKTWKIVDTNSNNATCSLIMDVNGKSNLNSMSQMLPSGAYTTFCTLDRGKVMHIEEHFNRLEETAALSQAPVRIDHEKIRSALRKTVGTLPIEQDYRVRLTLDLTDHPGDIYISVEPLSAPSELMYVEGVKVITRRFHRTNPKAKLTSFIKKAEEILEEKPADVNEVIMLDNCGCVLEGTSSNFFGVMNGSIYTADEGVLRGLTRAIVIELIQKCGFPIVYQGVCKENFTVLDEAFITSASRAVLPVRMIDNIVVGSGVPGPISKRLLHSFREKIITEAENF